MYKPPTDFEQQLTSFRGTNLYSEPNLKVVLAPQERDRDGYPKFINPLTNRGFECWILMRWVPAEFFGDFTNWKDEWKRLGDSGVFPSRGDYVMICPLSETGDFEPLDGRMFKSIQRKIWEDEEFASLSNEGRYDFIVQQEADKQANLDYISKKKEEERDEHYRLNWGNINRKQGAGYSLPG